MTMDLLTPERYVSHNNLSAERDNGLENAVVMRNVFFGYKKDVLILNDVSVEVPKGKIYALLGSSGCGKTTLLRIILGRLKPESGCVRVFGIEPGSKKSNIPGNGVGYMPQETALFSEFTIEEILYYFGNLYNLDMSIIDKRTTHLVELLNLPKKQKKICQLSGGQQRLVSIAATMIHKPPLLILDEPTVGIDPLLRCRIWDYLENKCKSEGLTVIITTHYIEEAKNAATVAFIDSGMLLTQSEPNELMLRHKSVTLEDVFFQLCKDKRKMKLDQTLKSQNYKGDENLKDNIVLKQENLFNFNRTKALLWKNHLLVFENRFVLFLFILLPVVEITLFCLCTGQKPQNLPVSIYNPDFMGNFSQLFLQEIDRELIHKDYYPSKELAIESVTKGETFYSISFSENFSDSFKNRVLDVYDMTEEDEKHSQIKLYADNSNSFVGLYIFQSLLDSFQKFLISSSATLGYNPSAFLIPFSIEEFIYGSNESSLYEFTAPGVIIVIIHVTPMLISALLILIERKQGHLERSLVAGVKPIEILFSHIVMLFMAILAKVLLLMIFSFMIFDIPLKGSVLDAFGIILLQGLQGMSFGLLISVISTDEATAFILVFGICLPMWLLCGVFWPLEAIPQILYKIAHFAPLTLPIEALRCILLRGWSVLDAQVTFGYLISGSYNIVLIIITALLFEKFSK